MSKAASAAEVIRRLGLVPHPEGGHFREVYRHARPDGDRGALTSIYYLLAEGEESAWHRVVDACEVWNWHAGAALALSLAQDGGPAAIRLGSDFAAGELPQAVVPAGMWQRAETLGAWTLVGCVVAPAFSFSGFELAPKGWRPGAGAVP